MGIFINIMPKPKQFNYSPLYYDERKERLEKIKARAEATTPSLVGRAGEGLAEQKNGLEKGFITESRANSKKYSLSFEKTSVVRLLIALALIGLFYLLMPEFFTSLWRR